MNRVRTQDDLRVVEETDYKAQHIRVVCGYSALEDSYLVHLYITPPGGHEVRVFDTPRRENTLQAALDLGFGVAESEIDLQAP